MDIKKVESSVKPREEEAEPEKNSNPRNNGKRIRSRNFPRFARSQLERVDSTLSDYPADRG